MCRELTRVAPSVVKGAAVGFSPPDHANVCMYVSMYVPNLNIPPSIASAFLATLRPPNRPFLAKSKSKSTWTWTPKVVGLGARFRGSPSAHHFRPPAHRSHSQGSGDHVPLLLLLAGQGGRDFLGPEWTPRQLLCDRVEVHSAAGRHGGGGGSLRRETGQGFARVASPGDVVVCPGRRHSSGGGQRGGNGARLPAPGIRKGKVEKNVSVVCLVIQLRYVWRAVSGILSVVGRLETEKWEEPTVSAPGNSGWRV